MAVQPEKPLLYGKRKKFSYVDNVTGSSSEEKRVVNGGKASEEKWNRLGREKNTSREMPGTGVYKVIVSATVGGNGCGEL